MIKSNNLIIEKLKLIYEYDKGFFDYNYLMKDIWSELLKKAMDEFKIRFDIENNDSRGIQRIVRINETKFKCELCGAGGDWETITNYFKIQLIDGYCYGHGKYRDSFFIFIPNKEQGNYHLVSNKKETHLYPIENNDDYKNEDKLKPDDKKCWESLNLYLKELVNKEISINKKEK